MNSKLNSYQKPKWKQTALKWFMRLLLPSVFLGAYGLNKLDYASKGYNYRVKIFSADDWADAENSRREQQFDKTLGWICLTPIPLLVLLFILQRDEKETRVMREAAESEKQRKQEHEQIREERLKQNPDRCPSCFSEEIDVHVPSKPGLFITPSLSGVILAAGSTAAADMIYRPEKVCLKCGDRWLAPEY